MKRRNALTIEVATTVWLAGLGLAIGTMAGTPPQGNDAKCGLACHTVAKTRDYVFTEFPKR